MTPSQSPTVSENLPDRLRGIVARISNDGNFRLSEDEFAALVELCRPWPTNHLAVLNFSPTVSEAEVEAAHAAYRESESENRTNRNSIIAALTTAAKVRAEDTTAPETLSALVERHGFVLAYSGCPSEWRAKREDLEKITAAPSPTLNRDALVDEMVKALNDIVRNGSIYVENSPQDRTARPLVEHALAALQAVAKAKGAAS